MNPQNSTRATPDNGSLQITKLPHNAKHRKYDKDSKMQSRQNKVKKNGRTYKDLQRKRKAKNEKITNRPEDQLSAGCSRCDVHIILMSK